MDQPTLDHFGPDGIDRTRESLTALTEPGLAPLFWRPERLGSASAWWQHVPFAHWLVTHSVPRRLVELGTHNGVSYSAFCEAVSRAQLGTDCYAVDTWRGDPHAGEYGDDVYQEFRRFHDERYGAFSTLLRCTFDEALDRIGDGSVDLLHIDGLHTYEAVRHDFESWKPKLSERAVVVFHDTKERGRDFGVWRLWLELTRRYPSFEFLHGHGLGVLAVGDRIAPAVASLCDLAEPNPIAAVRERFARLGERWSAENRERALAEHLGARLAAASAAATAAEAQAAQAETRAVTAEERAARAIGAAAAEGARAARAAAETTTALRRAGEAEATAARARAAQIAAEAAADARAMQAAAEAAQARRDYLGMVRERDEILQSTAWRLTWPARAAGARLPAGVRRLLRSNAELAWWALSLRGSRKMRERGGERSPVSTLASPPGASAWITEDRSKLRVCVYTAIYGGYDELKLQPEQSVACDFICFSDQAGPSKIGDWRVIRARRPSAMHPRMQAKFFKLMSHKVFPGGRLAWRYDPFGALLDRRPAYGALVWIDASVQIKSAQFVEQFVGHIGASGWAMLAHPDRDCIYDEARVSLEIRKYQGLPIEQQVESYRREGHPARNGLMACTVIARASRDPRLAEVNEAWWRENLRWTYQDQLSLPVVLRRLAHGYEPVPLDLWRNEWFATLPHKTDL